MKEICPNCDKEIIRIKCLYCGLNKFMNHRCTSNTTYTQFQCCNHPIAVDYFLSIRELKTLFIVLSSNKYIIYIYPDKNAMKIDDYVSSSYIRLPQDPYLTPENFNNKLKTYLIFQ